MRAALWGALGISMAVASGVTPASTGRTMDDLPTMAWCFLVGWSFAGWIIASLKPAVIAMNDGAQPRSVIVAGIISTFVASLAFGVACGLYLLTEARWGDKPLAALYGYLGALFGGFSGMKGMEFAIDLLQGIVQRWADKGKRENI